MDKATLGELLLGTSVLESWLRDVDGRHHGDGALEAAILAVRRFAHGDLAGRSHEGKILEQALLDALSGGTLAVAWRLRDPEDGAWTALLESGPNWSQERSRLADRLQVVTCDGDATTRWAGLLAAAGSDLEALRDFPFSSVAEETSVEYLAARISDHYLAWVARHCHGEGEQPPGLEVMVREGGANPLHGSVECNFHQVCSQILTGRLNAAAETSLGLTQAFQNELGVHVTSGDAALRAPNPSPAAAKASASGGWFRRLVRIAPRVVLVLLIALVAFIKIVQRNHQKQQHAGTIAKSQEDRNPLALALVKATFTPNLVVPADKSIFFRFSRNRAKQEVGRTMGLTVEEVDKAAGAWVASVRAAKMPAAMDLARAAWLGGRLSDASAGALEAVRLGEILLRADPGSEARWRRQISEASELAADAELATKYAARAPTSYRKALEHVSRVEDPARWGVLTLKIGIAHRELALLREEPGVAANLGEALRAHRAAMEALQPGNSPIRQAGLRHLLGILLTGVAEFKMGEEAVESLEEAADSFRAALGLLGPEAEPQDRATTLQSLAAALQASADLQFGTDAWGRLLEAEAAWAESLTVFSRDSHLEEWALARAGQGAVWSRMAGHLEGGERLTCLRQAVQACREAMQFFTEESHPFSWMQNQGRLGNVFIELAGELEGAAGVAPLEESIQAFGLGLRICTRELRPSDWAAFQSNLATALRLLGDRLEGEAGLRRYGEATKAYRAALEVNTREARPHSWAVTHNNLGITAFRMAERSQGEQRMALLRAAAAAFEAALQFLKLDENPQDHLSTSLNLDEVRRLLKEAEGNR